MDKIIATSKISSNASLHYMSNSIELDKKISSMIDKTQQAMNHGLCVLLSYQSLKDETPIEFEVEPYEIIHYHKSYYLIINCHLFLPSRILHATGGYCFFTPNWPEIITRSHESIT